MSIIISATDGVVYEQVADDKFLKFVNNKTDGKLIDKNEAMPSSELSDSDLMRDDDIIVLEETDDTDCYRFPCWLGGSYIGDIIAVFGRDPRYFSPEIKSEKDDRSSFYIHDAIIDVIDKLRTMIDHYSLITKENNAWDALRPLYKYTPVISWINQAMVEEYGIEVVNQIYPSRDYCLNVAIRKIWLNVTYSKETIPEGDYEIWKAYLEDVQSPSFKKEYEEWKKAGHDVMYSPYLK